ncbi:MAG: dihydrofolate reductase family protein [bacterium]
MRRLLPEPAQTSVAEQVDALDFVSLAHVDRPYTVTNFALTLDGRATISGRSGAIGSDSDTEMLVRLRTTVDAIMIGAGTMRAERYGRPVADQHKRARRERRGLPGDPLMCIVSNSLDLPWDADLFTGGQGRVVCFTASERSPPPTETPVRVVRHRGRVDLPEAFRYLRRERGVRALLSEGGPRLHAEMIAAGLVDELFVTLAPKLIGGDGPHLVEGLAEHERPLDLAWLLDDEGELFARYRVKR